MLRTLALIVTLSFACGTGADAAPVHSDFLHSGQLAILTTSAGADLPASVRVENFPVLVRLTGETFDFSQVQPHGEDVRFSAEGTPLAYQIDTWDATCGTAAIWVRVPVIKGDSRQLITMHWGHANARSESSGPAVFNESNGYAMAMHLGGAANPVADEVGTVSAVDEGTTSSSGIIGLSRRFAPGHGIACGEQITGLPIGHGPSTTQAWIRAARVNTTVVGWGNEEPQGKVILGVGSPPHLRVECYFSSADVRGETRAPMAEWVQVTHTYQPGDSRIYMDGRLDGVASGRDSLLNIRTPSRMWLGGWYNNYQFVGEIDEFRISTVARSADWIRLEYENQKPLQTLVGMLVPAGREFSVSHSHVTVEEGQSETLTAQAGGAEKLYWVLQRDGDESVVAVDCFSYTLPVARVVGDTRWLLKLQAVFPEEIRTIEVPITIRENVPEPDVVLTAPEAWNGRETIEVVPVIQNLAAIHAAGGAQFRYRWTATGGAVIQQVAPDRLILKRSQFSGPLTVRAEIDNGGKATVASALINVTEPATDPWIVRGPEPDEKPEEGQFYPRDAEGLGTLYYTGTLAEPCDSVFLKVYADERHYSTQTKYLTSDATYSFAVKLEPGLVKYRVEFGTTSDAKQTVRDRVGDLVCGDAFLIDGQSNALATDTGEEAPRDTSEWIRSYGGPTGRDDGVGWVRNRVQAARDSGLTRPNLWCRPVWKIDRPEQQAELGYWGMELAKRLVASQKMPICIINAAVGGTRIDEHQPSVTERADLQTMYGRMLWRVRQARLTHGIRAVIWHQGESDQGSDGPTGGYGWETYQQLFVNMSAAWKEDLPNIDHYYVFQIWPDACAMGGRAGSGDRLREVQRTLPRLYSRMSIMSTLGIQPPGGCHYPLEGWAEFARLLQPLIERDLYGRAPTTSITPPDLLAANYTTSVGDEVRLEFDQPVVWDDASATQFFLDDEAGQVASGSTDGNVLLLKLSVPSAARRITYLKERDWNQDRLLVGANGLAALTFCDVPIFPPQPQEIR